MGTGTSRLGVLLALVSLPASAGAVTIVRGPYLQQVTTDSAIVVVDVDEACEAQVRVEPQAGGEELVAPTGAVGQHHEIVVQGLMADTTYGYGVYTADEILLSGEHTLRTAVLPGTSFQFLAYGDSRSGHEDHAAVIAAMAGRDARFLLHTGDLVADGEDEEDWDAFFGIVGDTLHDLPIYPVLGNHDEDSGEAPLFEGAFALPGKELYYSFEMGNAHFVVLDQYVHADLVCAQDDQLVDNCLDAEQLEWLSADLAAARANPVIDHIFVSAHEGPYSSKGSRDGSLQMRVLLPLFAEHRVTALITGHDHYYERGVSGNGIPYVTTGGGGAPLYGIGEPSEDPHTISLNAAAHHFVLVGVNGEEATFTTIDSTGATLDTVTVAVPDAVVVPADDIGADRPEVGASGGGGCGCRVALGARGGAIAWLALAGAWLRRRPRPRRASPGS